MEEMGMAAGVEKENFHFWFFSAYYFILFFSVFGQGPGINFVDEKSLCLEKHVWLLIHILRSAFQKATFLFLGHHCSQRCI